jgi:hypothetical protein
MIGAIPGIYEVHNDIDRYTPAEKTWYKATRVKRIKEILQVEKRRKKL